MKYNLNNKLLEIDKNLVLIKFIIDIINLIEIII